MYANRVLKEKRLMYVKPDEMRGLKTGTRLLPKSILVNFGYE